MPHQNIPRSELLVIDLVVLNELGDFVFFFGFGASQ
jgi:hypothetical protein